jgi:hypothetical protein
LLYGDWRKEVGKMRYVKKQVKGERTFRAAGARYLRRQGAVRKEM